jgi:toxin ParE1/3/4
MAAFVDREAILNRLHKRSEGGASNVIASIKAAVQLLSEQPDSGLKTNAPGVLVLVLSDYPYLIFYRVRRDTLELLHIRHTSRRVRG